MIFSFSHPQYLFFLFVIPLVFFIHLFALGSKKKKALKFANFESIARIEGIDFFSKNIVILFLNVFIILFLVFAISGLTFHTTAQSSDFSFVLAIDSSQSMNADDFSPNRITAAKQAAVDFVDSAPIGVKIGVISFSGSSKIEKDMIDRKDELKSAINGITIETIGGTDLYEAVLTGANLLKPVDSKAIVLLSDGQVNVGDIDEAIDYANRYNVVVHTIGMGTKEGGQAEYGLSTLDEDSLKSLAYNTNGKYFSAENKENLTNAFSSLFNLTEMNVSIELFDYLLIIALILIVLEFLLNNTRYIHLP